MAQQRIQFVQFTHSGADWNLRQKANTSYVLFNRVTFSLLHTLDTHACVCMCVSIFVRSSTLLPMQDMKLRNHGKTFDKGFKSFRSAEKFLATPEIFYWRKRYTLAHTPYLSLHKTCMWINTLSSDFINSLVKPFTNNISYKLQRRHHHPKTWWFSCLYVYLYSAVIDSTGIVSNETRTRGHHTHTHIHTENVFIFDGISV